jgi:hypothetical protein
VLPVLPFQIQAPLALSSRVFEVPFFSLNNIAPSSVLPGLRFKPDMPRRHRALLVELRIFRARTESADNQKAALPRSLLPHVSRFVLATPSERTNAALPSVIAASGMLSGNRRSRPSRTMYFALDSLRGVISFTLSSSHNSRTACVADQRMRSTFGDSMSRLTCFYQTSSSFILFDKRYAITTLVQTHAPQAFQQFPLRQS